MTRRAKLFQNQEGQAVRLPDDFRFEDQEEVSIYRQGDRLILEPVRRKWSRAFLDLAGSAPDFPDPDEPTRTPGGGVRGPVVAFFEGSEGDGELPSSTTNRGINARASSGAP
jgi:antitoxin VapB